MFCEVLFQSDDDLNTCSTMAALTGVYMAARIIGFDSMCVLKSNPDSDSVIEWIVIIIPFTSFSTSSFASVSSSVCCDILSPICFSRRLVAHGRLVM